MLLEVLLLPAQFWKKYCSCGGRSDGGVGVRFRRGPFRPHFEGVAGTAGSVIDSSSLLPCKSFSSVSSAPQMCVASKSSSSAMSVPSSPAAIPRSIKVLTLLRRADRSTLWATGVSIVPSPSALAFDGVSNSFLPLSPDWGVFCCLDLPESDLILFVLPGGRPRRRF